MENWYDYIFFVVSLLVELFFGVLGLLIFYGIMSDGFKKIIKEYVLKQNVKKLMKQYPAEYIFNAYIAEETKKKQYVRYIRKGKYGKKARKEAIISKRDKRAFQKDEKKVRRKLLKIEENIELLYRIKRQFTPKETKVQNTQKVFEVQETEIYKDIFGNEITTDFLNKLEADFLKFKDKYYLKKKVQLKNLKTIAKEVEDIGLDTWIYNNRERIENLGLDPYNIILIKLAIARNKNEKSKIIDTYIYMVDLLIKSIQEQEEQKLQQKQQQELQQKQQQERQTVKEKVIELILKPGIPKDEVLNIFIKFLNSEIGYDEIIQYIESKQQPEQTTEYKTVDVWLTLGTMYVCLPMKQSRIDEVNQVAEANNLTFSQAYEKLMKNKVKD